MLISPPFLPPRQASQTEDQWLEAAMPQVPGDGRFPISHLLGWHGGVHLEAPVRGDGREPVRAIADGTVLFVRRGENTRNDDPNHVLNYNGWTSNGVVVIQHDTEIGANAQDQAVSVRFYSVYMHVYDVVPGLSAGKRIYRKDEIGRAGYIEGNPHRFHFEICCDSDNLQRLIGRQTGDLAVTADGRADVVFGDLYFHLPAGTPIYAEQPLPNSPTARSQPPKPNAKAPLPAPVTLSATHTTTETLVVSLRYAMGEEVPLAGSERSGRGDTLLTTLRAARNAQGKPLCGPYEALGSPVVERDGEYNLYTTATRIADAYPATGCPAPSAVYELLRFGRVINTAHETLTPADVPHWRRIAYPGGQGWVNLNNQTAGQEVRKFSDADFPHWRGWTLIDDHADGDSRCDSSTIRAWLSEEQDWTVNPALALARLDEPKHAKRFKHTICCFPSEWDASTIDQRWAWLKTLSPENPSNLDEASYAAFKGFWQALCFPAPNLFAAQWCFHPREFIRIFRKCSWLNLSEFSQLLPRVNGVKTWQEAKSRFLDRGYINFNNIFKKYNITSINRQASFLAQIYIETGFLKFVEEVGKGQPNSKLPMTKYYGAFFGRGIMQLTWPENYAFYGKYRKFPNHTGSYGDTRITATSEHDWSAPKKDHDKVIRNTELWSPRYDPTIISNNSYNCCDSGAFFWVQKKFTGTSNINRISDESIDTEHIGRISVLVNGGGNGYNERLVYACFIYRYRSDSTETTLTETISAVRQKISHGHWISVGDVFTLNVNYTPQRP